MEMLDLARNYDEVTGYLQDNSNFKQKIASDVL